MKILYFVFWFFFLQIVIATDSSTSDSSSDSSGDSKPCKIKYSYTLWFGDTVDKAYTIKLKSDCGIKFIDAMDQAAAKNSKYTYTKEMFGSLGAFITSISGVQNDNVLSQYWMIYELTSKPGVDNKPPDSFQTEVGVSSLDVVDDHHYLFWFKTVHWHK